MTTEGIGTVEEQASAMGWRPDGKLSAQEFVERAEQRLDISRGTNKQLLREVRRLSATNEELQSTIGSIRADMTQFVEFHKESEKRGYEKALRDVKAEQQQAFNDGNEPAFRAASEKLDQLIKSHPAVVGKDLGEPKPAVREKSPSSVNTGNPELDRWLGTEPGALDDWMSQNTWFNEDLEMADYAEKVDKMLHRKYKLSIPQSQHLEEVTNEVKKKFPNYKAWANPRRAAAAAVEGGGAGAPVKGDRTYDALPPEARTQCDKWTGVDGTGKTGTMPGFTRDDYVKAYKWGKE